tara:strand:+ start:544 stop:1197 length:654 start_codon:yes stop_codon:yes gene_type:complete
MNGSLKQRKIDVVLGIDPGYTGGLCILLGDAPVVIDPPVRKTQRSAKSKIRTEFDLERMRDILKPFEDQSVVFGIELVSARPGEGTVSSFNFGAGFASWKACATCFGFEVLEISPRKWKQAYPELVKSDQTEEIRDEIKALRSQLKNLVQDSDKSDANKQINALKHKIKYHAKDTARELAQEMFPDIADSFKRKKDDGRAEACLIAYFLKEHYGELV